MPSPCVHTLFCPETGRGFEFGDCVRRDGRLTSPYAHVAPKLSGSAFLLCAIGLTLGLSVLDLGDQRFGIVAASVILGCGVMAVIRYAKQYRAWTRRGRE